MGHRAAADRRPSRALRRRRGARQDRGRGTPALPRRPSWRRPLTESDLRDRIRLVLIRFVLCVGGGFTLGLAYPAIDWAGTAWIALVPVFYVAVTAPPRTAFGWGWLAGFAFFLPLLRSLLRSRCGGDGLDRPPPRRRLGLPGRAHPVGRR